MPSCNAEVVNLHTLLSAFKDGAEQIVLDRLKLA